MLSEIAKENEVYLVGGKHTSDFKNQLCTMEREMGLSLHSQPNLNTRETLQVIYYLPGSIPEEDGGKLYNSCAVFDPEGQMILKHRKVLMHHPFQTTDFSPSVKLF